MGVALGLEPPKAVWLTSRYHTQYYDDIPGLSVDASVDSESPTGPHISPHAALDGASR